MRRSPTSACSQSAWTWCAAFLRANTPALPKTVSRSQRCSARIRSGRSLSTCDFPPSPELSRRSRGPVKPPREGNEEKVGSPTDKAFSIISQEVLDERCCGNRPIYPGGLAPGDHLEAVVHGPGRADRLGTRRFRL